ncbi:hypothetical protein CGRA01v4_08616 [Colletotrichum graminicola]|nr:hypothetical protein CGRA01v4_08616 [Colletotrichum graminicola]
MRSRRACVCKAKEAAFAGNAATLDASHAEPSVDSVTILSHALLSCSG